MSEEERLGDKLLPAFLRELGEPIGAAIDNIDRAERLGLMPSAETWTGAACVQAFVADSQRRGWPTTSKGSAN